MTATLAGLRLLVTREPAAAAAWIEELAARGARVDARAVIAFEPAPDAAAAHAALARLARFGWVVLTSANGARFFAAACRAAAVVRPAGLRVAAIGRATAAAAQALGWAADFVPPQADAAAFGAALAAEIGAGVRALVARPETGRPELTEALRAAGVQVDEVVVYRTVAARGVGAIATDVRDGRYDAIVFTAPSAFAFLAACAPDVAGLARALADVRRVAIGTTTAAALAAAGLPAVVAARPDTAAIVAAVEAASRGRGAAAPCYHPPSANRVRAGADTTRRSAGDDAVPEELKHTPLHGVHLDAGARMVAFAGWHMPVQYSGVVDEHRAVRTRAGLFDVSHMGELFVAGREAERLLQRVTCNDVARLAVGRAHYSGLLTPAGTFHDDLLIYRLAADGFMLVLNAGNATKDVAWIHEQASGHDVTLDDRSADTALLALQGPAATAILQGLVATDLSAVRYYGFFSGDVCGAPCIVSRTGYTGEDGFEIYAPASAARAIWTALCAAGRPHGLQPIGLAARDTLRLEAKMALYGNDIDDTTTALEADLGWIVKFKKGEFIGREALLRQQETGVRRKLVGFEMRGRAIARHGYPALVGDREAGRVTSGTFAPFLEQSIGLVYLPIERTEIGSEFGVGIRGRVEPAVVVKTPFYKRPE